MDDLYKKLETKLKELIRDFEVEKSRLEKEIEERSVQLRYIEEDIELFHERLEIAHRNWG